MPELILNPTQSTYLSYGAANNNYSANDWIRCGVQSTTSTRYLSLFQFDLSDIPLRSIIDSAVLKLWSFDDGFTWNAETTQLAKMNIEAWAAGTATYNNRPDTTDDDQASGTNSGYNTWYSWDMQALVQSWANGNANYGLTLIQDGLTTAKGKCFKKSGVYVPKLTINYTPVGCSAKSAGVWERGLVYAKDGGVWGQGLLYSKDGTWKQGV